MSKLPKHPSDRSVPHGSAMGFTGRMKSVAGAVAVLALATSGVATAQDNDTVQAQEQNPSADTNAPAVVGAPTNELAPGQGAAVLEGVKVENPEDGLVGTVYDGAGNPATRATVTIDSNTGEITVQLPGNTPQGTGTLVINTADGAEIGSVDLNIMETRSLGLRMRIDGKAVTVQPGDGGANAYRSVPEYLRDVNLVLTSQETGEVYRSDDNGATWRGNEGFAAVKNFGLQWLPAGDYDVTIEGIDGLADNGLRVSETSAFQDGGTFTLTRTMGDPYLSLVTIKEPEDQETQKVVMGVRIDGKGVLVEERGNAAGALPESVRDVVVTLIGEDGTEYKSNANGETWRGNPNYPAVQNFGLVDIPHGTYTVQIDGLEDIDKDGLELSENSEFHPEKGFTIEKPWANKFLALLTVKPEYEPITNDSLTSTPEYEDKADGTPFAPENPTFELVDKPEGAEIDPETGEITYELPTDADTEVPETLTVKITYRAGNTATVEVPVEITVPENGTDEDTDTDTDSEDSDGDKDGEDTDTDTDSEDTDTEDTDDKPEKPSVPTFPGGSSGNDNSTTPNKPGTPGPEGNGGADQGTPGADQGDTGSEDTGAGAGLKDLTESTESGGQGASGATQSGAPQGAGSGAQSGAAGQTGAGSGSTSADRGGQLAMTGVSGVALTLGAAAMAMAVGGALLALRRHRN